MIYGLLGKKLGHSYSPEIHEAFGRYSYRLIELREDQLEEFLKSPEIGGLNVTIPYKEAVVKHCRRLTPLAERIGAVNTISNMFSITQTYAQNLWPGGTCNTGM